MDQQKDYNNLCNKIAKLSTPKSNYTPTKINDNYEPFDSIAHTECIEELKNIMDACSKRMVELSRKKENE